MTGRLLIWIIVNCFPTRLVPNIPYFEHNNLGNYIFGISEFVSAILKKYTRKPFFGDQSAVFDSTHLMQFCDIDREVKASIVQCMGP